MVYIYLDRIVIETKDVYSYLSKDKKKVKKKLTYLNKRQITSLLQSRLREELLLTFIFKDASKSMIMKSGRILYADNNYIHLATIENNKYTCQVELIPIRCIRSVTQEDSFNSIERLLVVHKSNISISTTSSLSIETYSAALS